MFASGLAHFFRMGGAAMYLTALLGLVLLGASGLSLVAPRWAIPSRALGLLGAAVAGSGLLGFVAGMGELFTALSHVAIRAEDRVPILFAGTGEALTNLVLAGLFLVPAALLAAGSRLRAGDGSREPVRTAVAF